jgi:hypothetical protein
LCEGRVAQIENERLVNELVQLRDRATLAEEAMNQRDREVQQLREEVQKWAEYFQSLSIKCSLLVEKAVSSINALKHDLRAPSDLNLSSTVLNGAHVPTLQSNIVCQNVKQGT